MKFNFTITSEKPISLQLKSLGNQEFYQVAEWVKNLPYKRNQDKSNPFCIIDDFGGTCSTKHAFLKLFAEENEFSELKLMLGIFRMNGNNTPKIAEVLRKYHLSEIPEAHNYLKFENEILDFTRKNSSAKDFEKDLIVEIEINPNQITDFKVKYHQDFIKQYLQEHPKIRYSLSDFWKIREECIAMLQK